MEASTLSYYQASSCETDSPLLHGFHGLFLNMCTKQEKRDLPRCHPSDSGHATPQRKDAQLCPGASGWTSRDQDFCCLFTLLDLFRYGWHGTRILEQNLRMRKAFGVKQKYESSKSWRIAALAGRESWGRDGTLSDTFRYESGNTFFFALLVNMPRFYILC